MAHVLLLLLFSLYPHSPTQCRIASLPTTNHTLRERQRPTRSQKVFNSLESVETRSDRQRASCQINQPIESRYRARMKRFDFVLEEKILSFCLCLVCVWSVNDHYSLSDNSYR